MNEPYSHNLGLGPKDFEVVLEVCYVRARFKALDVLVFMAPSASPCIFLVPRLAFRTICAALAS